MVELSYTRREVSIVSIQADQSRHCATGERKVLQCRVSIVSIQADQSRLYQINLICYGMAEFQSYQFRQINPDDDYGEHAGGEFHWFQSYQFRQINPDSVVETRYTTTTSFNRINSGRSIPTKNETARKTLLTLGFNRINSGRSIPTWWSVHRRAFIESVSIVSIQADQSRPGLHARNFYQVALTFQSYQFRQINPDKIENMYDVPSYKCFNRINSGRSIPTRLYSICIYRLGLGFNRINSGRSIPTALGQ